MTARPPGGPSQSGDGVGDFASGHECWSEQQAAQCERNIEEIMKSVAVHIERLAGKTKRPSLDYLYLTTGLLHECAVRINVYAQMADNHRRGRWAREEAEQYKAAMNPSHEGGKDGPRG